MASNEGPRRNRNRSVLSDSQSEEHLESSALESAADNSTVASDPPDNNNLAIVHEPPAQRPSKRCKVTELRAKSPPARTLTVAQLEKEDMINAQKWKSGLAVKFYRKNIDQFLAQCESELQLWDVKTEFVCAMLVFQQIPSDLRYAWDLVPPVRGDLKAYQTLTQTLRKKGKKINKVERGIDAIYKLKYSNERPEVIAKKLVEMVGVPNAEPDKTNEDMQEFLKCCLLDTLPTATAEAFRLTYTDMSFTKLVDKADELYNNDPLPNPYEPSQ